MMIESDSLLYGVEFPAGSGQLHYDFTLRLPSVGDNIVALETLGPDSNLALNVAMMARCLVKLGDIPPESISYELLRDGLVDEDYDVLAAARETLKKKRMRSSSTLPATGSPSSPSAASDSARIASTS